MIGKYNKKLKNLSINELQNLILEATELLTIKEELVNFTLIELEKSQIELNKLLENSDNIFIYNPDDSYRWFIDEHPLLPYEYSYIVVKRSELINYGIE